LLMLNKKGVTEDINAIKEKLSNPEKKAECIAEMKKLIDVKYSNLLQVEGCSSCCGSICGVDSLLEAEMGILQSALDAIIVNDIKNAAFLLEDYLVFVEKNYENETSIPMTSG